MRKEACPGVSRIVSGETPTPSISVAVIRRRSWKRFGSRPASRISRCTGASRFGFALGVSPAPSNRNPEFGAPPSDPPRVDAAAYREAPRPVGAEGSRSKPDGESPGLVTFVWIATASGGPLHVTGVSTSRKLSMTSDVASKGAFRGPKREYERKAA